MCFSRFLRFLPITAFCRPNSPQNASGVSQSRGWSKWYSMSNDELTEPANCACSNIINASRLAVRRTGVPVDILGWKFEGFRSSHQTITTRGCIIPLWTSHRLYYHSMKDSSKPYGVTRSDEVDMAIRFTNQTSRNFPLPSALAVWTLSGDPVAIFLSLADTTAGQTEEFGRMITCSNQALQITRMRGKLFEHTSE